MMQLAMSQIQIIDYSLIKALRNGCKISQSKLAQMSGVSPYRISAFELNKEFPTKQEFDKLQTTLTNVKDSIAKNQFNRKKRIVKSANLDKNLPKPIISKTDYLEQIFSKNKTEYVETLNAVIEQANDETVKKHKGIALFSGCGGFTLGFEANKFNILGHVEIDKSANRIYAENFPKSELLGEDIRAITDEQIKSWKEKFGELDVIIGGPPCQGFSLAGKRDPLDERNHFYQYHANIVKIMQPKTFVMENVAQMVSLKDKNGKFFIDKIKKIFDDIGYSTYHIICNVANYGIPQDRNRIIIIGVRKDVDKGNFNFKINEIGKRTFYDATYDLETLESGEQSKTDALHWAVTHPKHIIDMLSIVPEGHSAHENADLKLRPTSGFSTTYKRIRWNEPCSTISTNFSMISGCRNVHPTNTRSLTIREACRSQSFPDKFSFVGNWGDVRRAIGNAVPPLFAKTLAELVIHQILQTND
jgi:DNA (cytosine-5)-methyltransferase 1